MCSVVKSCLFHRTKTEGCPLWYGKKRRGIRFGIAFGGGLCYNISTMKQYPRIYTTLIAEQLRQYSQMAFLSGPRQVGKTTVSKELATDYLSWEDDQVRRAIKQGQSAVVETFGLAKLAAKAPIVAFDEIHKYNHWKQFLKGFYDVYSKAIKVIVTGSARLDVYKHGGDSMMGRYFPYRMHPFSVAELLTVDLPDEGLIRKPQCLADDEWAALLTFGGYPDPFVRRDKRFSRRWNTLRFEQLMQFDIRDLTQIVELDQLTTLAALLNHRSGEQLVYKNIAVEVGVDEKTVKKWVTALKSLYFGFEVRPWFKNIENSLRKTPKWYMRDWSQIEDEGKRAETLVACHLLKAVEGWTDMGYGEFSLGYLRDKVKREVDFVVIRDDAPWFLVEVKNHDTKLSPSLGYYQQKLGAKHAFQVVLDAPYVDRNCFEVETPIAVPARTFLSQLF